MGTATGAAKAQRRACSAAAGSSLLMRLTAVSGLAGAHLQLAAATQLQGLEGGEAAVEEGRVEVVQTAHQASTQRERGNHHGSTHSLLRPNTGVFVAPPGGGEAALELAGTQQLDVAGERRVPVGADQARSLHVCRRQPRHHPPPHISRQLTPPPRAAQQRRHSRRDGGAGRRRSGAGRGCRLRRPVAGDQRCQQARAAAGRLPPAAASR
jgi:hypothetical protein